MPAVNPSIPEGNYYVAFGGTELRDAPRQPDHGA